MKRTIMQIGKQRCDGVENAAKTTLQACGKMISWQVTVISTDGTILER